MIKRGEVYWIKTRPALIVSNDVSNIHAQTVTVLPLAPSSDRVYPFEVLVKPKTFGNKEAGKIKANQIRTVDKRHLGSPIGMLPRSVMAEVDRAMRLHLGL